MRLLGLGSESLIRIPTDETFRVDVKAMEEEIHRCQAAHLKARRTRTPGRVRVGLKGQSEARTGGAARSMVNFDQNGAWCKGVVKYESN